MRFFLAVIALGASLQAQGPVPNPFASQGPKQTAHLSVDASAAPMAVAAGGTVTLAFHVTPKKDIHVYAPGKHDYQVVSVEVAPQPWLKAAATNYPASEIYDFKPLNEKVEVYSKPFRLTREVTVLATPEAKKALAGQSSVTIAATLAYQACDDSVCYRPAKVPVSFTVKVQ
jgi:hypothetical protein